MGKRGPLMAAVDKAMEQAQKAQRDWNKGRRAFRLSTKGQRLGAKATTCQVPDWEEGERLANEKEVLDSLYRAIPLDKYAEKIRNCRSDFDG